MIREKRKVEQWVNVSHIDVGPGQYNPYSSNYGAKHNMT
jgi:hypothetical protein